MVEEKYLPKSQWGPGPWQDEPDELLFQYKGYQCRIKRNTWVTGHLNGYVVIPKNHPYSRFRKYSTIPIEIDCGLSYAKRLKNGDLEIGFGYDRLEDYRPMWMAQERTFSLFDKKEIEEVYDINNYKTIGVIRSEIEAIVDRLIYMDYRIKRKTKTA